MAAGVAPEPVVQRTLVRVLANVGAHELTARRGGLQAADNVLRQVVKVRLAPRQQVGSRLSEEILHAIGDEPRAHYGQGEAQPARM